MGSIVTISSSKGGSGKTTLAILLALSLGARGRQVAVIDADPNETMFDWFTSAHERSDQVAMNAMADPEKLVRAAYVAAETSDVLIDTAGFSNVTATHAIAISDTVLIPVMADRGSVREAMRTHTLVMKAGADRPIICRVVWSQWFSRGLAARAAMEDLEAAGIESLETQIPDLEGLRQLTFTGSLPPGRAQEVGAELIVELMRLKIIAPNVQQRGKTK